MICLFLLLCWHQPEHIQNILSCNTVKFFLQQRQIIDKPEVSNGSVCEVDSMVGVELDALSVEFYCLRILLCLEILICLTLQFFCFLQVLFSQSSTFICCHSDRFRFVNLKLSENEINELCYIVSNLNIYHQDITKYFLHVIVIVY